MWWQQVVNMWWKQVVEASGGSDSNPERRSAPCLPDATPNIYGLRFCVKTKSMFPPGKQRDSLLSIYPFSPSLSPFSSLPLIFNLNFPSLLFILYVYIFFFHIMFHRLVPGTKSACVCDIYFFLIYFSFSFLSAFLFILLLPLLSLIHFLVIPFCLSASPFPILRSPLIQILPISPIILCL